MIPTLVGNLPAELGSFLGGYLQKFLPFMAACNPGKCVTTCVQMGEKTVFPFADDIFELFWHRFHAPESKDDKWVSSKKEFKMVKGGLNARNIMLRSHIIAGSAAFSLTKTTPLVLMAVADPNYQSVMDELASEERYIDAEILHRKMIGEQLKNWLSLSKDVVLLKFRVRPTVQFVEKKLSTVEVLVHSKSGKKMSLNNLQLFSYRVARTKRVLKKEFSTIPTRRKSFSKIMERKSMATVDKVVKNATILGNCTSLKSIRVNSRLLNRFLKTASDSTARNRYFK